MLHDDTIVLDCFARSLIRRKVRLLVGRAGFTDQDREDLEQELILRLLQSRHLFNPDQAHANVFITTVIERAVAGILRERRAKKRHGGLVCSFEEGQEHNGQTSKPSDPRPSDQHEFDLTSDLAEVLACLPDDLRALAERLKVQTVSQAARELGLPRSTLQRQVERLRRCFEDAGLRNSL